MIFESTDSDSTKLSKACSHFLRTVSAHTRRRQEMDRAYAFRHGEQWDADAKEQLRQEGRAALVFNVCGSNVRELVGANEDQRREASVAPVGPEDLPTSQVVNHLWRREFERGGFDMTESTVFEHGVTGGVGFSFLDAQPDYESPGDACLIYKAVDPREVYYDILAREPNLTDSGYFYWARWLSETEFKSDYPEHADKFEELVSVKDIHSTPELDAGDRTGDLQYMGRTSADIYTDPQWFKDNRVRVIHLEYRVTVKRYYGTNPQTGETEEVQLDTYRKLKRLGLTDTYSTTTCEWRWFDFTGLQILFDDKQPLELGDKPQLRAFTAIYDENKRYHYGAVRDMQDPQMELNKRYSKELDLVSQQVQPGIIFDKGTFGSDTSVVERKLKAGGAAIEKQGQGNWEQLQPPTIPAGQETLRQAALDMMARVSGVDSNPLLGGQPDQVAVGTAYLAHRKGQLQITGLVKNFRAYQRSMLDSVIRAILQVFSDEQIQHMLGDNESLKVKDGVVYDLKKQTQISLEDLRSIRWKIEMDSAAANTTERLMTLQMLETLAAAGTVIDPEVMFENLPVSREQRQRLKNYAQEFQQSQAQAAQAQQAMAAKQVSDVLTIEMSKVQQKAAQAAQQSQDKQRSDILSAFVKVLDTFVDQVAHTQEVAQDKADHALNVAKSGLELHIADRAQRTAERAATQAA